MNSMPSMNSKNPMNWINRSLGTGRPGTGRPIWGRGAQAGTGRPGWVTQLCQYGPQWVPPMHDCSLFLLPQTEHGLKQMSRRLSDHCHPTLSHQHYALASYVPERKLHDHSFCLAWPHAVCTQLGNVVMVWVVCVCVARDALSGV